MLNLDSQAFVELVARSFGASETDSAFDSLPDKFEEIDNEVDFDLYLWSLAHRFKVDSEELLRQMGERWAVNLAESEASLRMEENTVLQSMDWLISETDHLARAPIVGANEFRAVVVSRGQDSLRACCAGARRCCSFLEGIARGLGKLSDESVRYVRQPQSSSMVEISFKTFQSE